LALFGREKENRVKINNTNVTECERGHTNINKNIVNVHDLTWEHGPDGCPVV